MNLYGDHLASMGELLARYDLLDAGEELVDADRAGEGNMNRVLRVTTDKRSLILKQSVPFVAKYPDIPAPVDRDRSEAAFYRAVAGTAAGTRMPKLLGHIEDEHLLVLEDFGDTCDYSRLYDAENPGEYLTREDLILLIDWLKGLHDLASPTAFDNVAMRELNHAHIFDLPFREHSNTALRRRAAELGALYLSVRDGSLLHGDYYPGSWLRTSAGPVIIDPEFAFVGPRAFDFGLLWAHLVMAGYDEIPMAEQAPLGVDASLMRAFAGVEIVRRLIGIAKLPRAASPEADAVLLDKATSMVLA